jgi:uncharacterized protein
MDYLLIFIFILGLIGAISTIFGIPGILLVYLGYAIFFFYYDPDLQMSLVTFIIISVLSLLTLFLDEILMYFGIKRVKTGKHTVLGAFLGGIAGFFIIPIIGFVIGAAVGAILFEYLYNRDFQNALKAGSVVAFAYVLSFVLKIILTFALFGYLLFLLVRS